MAHKINDVMQRPHRYFYEDGLVEIGVGGLFLAVGLLLQIVGAVQASPLFVVATAIGLLLLAISGTFLLRKVIRGLKERLTYPRTGYVSYRRGKPVPAHWLIFGATLVLAVALVVLPQQVSQMPISEGAVLGVILGFIAHRVGLGRFYLLGATAVLIGLAAALFTADDILGSTATFAAMGVAMLISGVWALQRYLRKYPTASES